MSPRPVSGIAPAAAEELALALRRPAWPLRSSRIELRVRLRQRRDQPLARGRVRRVGDRRVARGEELLLLQLDPLPRRVAEDTSNPGRHGEDLLELQLPVEEAVLAGDSRRASRTVAEVGAVAASARLALVESSRPAAGRPPAGARRRRSAARRSPLAAARRRPPSRGRRLQLAREQSPGRAGAGSAACLGRHVGERRRRRASIEAK